MKIRIKGNSVRFRLTRSELDRFGAEGYIEEQTAFGSATFTYAIIRKEGLDTLWADFDGSRLLLEVPAAEAARWVGTELVGLEHRQETTYGEELFLLLEKDFKCLDGDVREDQTDQFDHPSSHCNA